MSKKSLRPLFTIGKRGRLLVPRGHKSIIDGIDSIAHITPRAAQGSMPCLMVPAWPELALALPDISEAMKVEDGVGITVFWAFHKALGINVLVVYDNWDTHPDGVHKEYVVVYDAHRSFVIPSSTMAVQLVANAATAHALAPNGVFISEWPSTRAGGWTTSNIHGPMGTPSATWREYVMRSAFPDKNVRAVISPTHWRQDTLHGAASATLSSMTNMTELDIQDQLGIRDEEHALLEAIGITRDGVILVVQDMRDDRVLARVHVKFFLWTELPKDFFTPSLQRE